MKEEKELTAGEKFLRDRANETEHERRIRIHRILSTPTPNEETPQSTSVVSDLLKVVILLNPH